MLRFATGGGAISADTTGGTYTSLTGPIYYEAASGDVGTTGSSTIVLNVPSGFIFDTGGTAPTVLINRIGGGGANSRNINGLADGSTIAVTRTSTTLTITIASASNTGVTCSLTWQNIRVRPSAGTPLASGNMVKTGTATAAAVSGTTNFGTLTEVAGAANKLTIQTQPSATATAGVAFTQQPVVRIADQFGNVVTSDNTTVVTAARNAGSGTLQGTTTATAVNGIATFTNLYHTVATTITIDFTATGLTKATSSNIVAIELPQDSSRTVDSPASWTVVFRL